MSAETATVRTQLLRPLAVPRDDWADAWRAAWHAAAVLAALVVAVGLGAWLFTGRLDLAWPVIAAYGASGLQAMRQGRRGDLLLRASVLWVVTAGFAILAAWASLVPILGYVVVAALALVALFVPRAGRLWHQIGIAPFSGFLVAFLGFQGAFGPYGAPQREWGWLVVRELVVLGLVGLVAMWLVRSALAEREPAPAASAADVGDRAGARPAVTELLQALVALGGATVIGVVIDPGHFYWATIGALVVFMVPARLERRVSRVVHRLVGLALGLLVAAVLVPVLAPLGTFGPLLMLIVGVGLAGGVARVSYPWFVFWLTVGLVPATLLLESVDGTAPLVLRFVLNLIGVAVALLASFVVLPQRGADAREHRADPPTEPILL